MRESCKYVCMLEVTAKSSVHSRWLFYTNISVFLRLQAVKQDSSEHVFLLNIHLSVSWQPCHVTSTIKMTIQSLTFSSTMFLDPEIVTVTVATEGVASTGNDKKSGECKLGKFKVMLGFQQFKGVNINAVCFMFCRGSSV